MESIEGKKIKLFGNKFILSGVPGRINNQVTKTYNRYKIFGGDSCAEILNHLNCNKPHQIELNADMKVGGNIKCDNNLGLGIKSYERDYKKILDNSPLPNTWIIDEHTNVHEIKNEEITYDNSRYISGKWAYLP
jgi:hypothetical protein